MPDDEFVDVAYVELTFNGVVHWMAVTPEQARRWLKGEEAIGMGRGEPMVDKDGRLIEHHGLPRTRALRRSMPRCWVCRSTRGRGGVRLRRGGRKPRRAVGLRRWLSQSVDWRQRIRVPRVRSRQSAVSYALTQPDQADVGARVRIRRRSVEVAQAVRFPRCADACPPAPGRHRRARSRPRAHRSPRARRASSAAACLVQSSSSLRWSTQPVDWRQPTLSPVSTPVNQP
jgi:hypothetical protein